MDRTKLREVSVLRLTNGGYVAKLMKADRLVGDHEHGLPPGSPIMATPIHCLPGAPEGWIRDPGSYVVEVDAQHGLWFDWTDNDKYNTAIVPTVKGMNPITGLKTEDVAMHQYREKCPIHEINFAYDYFCEECGYKWPTQNYVSHPNILWYDGFRQLDGTVRQFFFSEEDQRDVASAIIGKKNTIPAFGFAFYRCKNERRPVIEEKYRGIPISTNNGIIDSHKNVYAGSTTATSYSYYVKCSNNTITSANSYSVSNTCGINSLGLDDSLKRRVNYHSPVHTPINWQVPPNEKFKEETSQERFVKDVSVGAGAKIRQNLEIDTTPLNEWGENPESVITLYFVFSEQMEQIIEKGGIKKLESVPEGYLENVPVG